MRLTISDNTTDLADAFVTKKEMQEIIDKLNRNGCDIKYCEDPYLHEPVSVLDDTSWFDDPDMGDR